MFDKNSDEYNELRKKHRSQFGLKFILNAVEIHDGNPAGVSIDYWSMVTENPLTGPTECVGYILANKIGDGVYMDHVKSGIHEFSYLINKDILGDFIDMYVEEDKRLAEVRVSCRHDTISDNVRIEIQERADKLGINIADTFFHCMCFQQLPQEVLDIVLPNGKTILDTVYDIEA